MSDNPYDHVTVDRSDDIEEPDLSINGGDVLKDQNGNKYRVIVDQVGHAELYQLDSVSESEIPYSSVSGSRSEPDVSSDSSAESDTADENRSDSRSDDDSASTWEDY